MFLANLTWQINSLPPLDTATVWKDAIPYGVHAESICLECTSACRYCQDGNCDNVTTDPVIDGGDDDDDDDGV